MPKWKPIRTAATPLLRPLLFRRRRVFCHPQGYHRSVERYLNIFLEEQGTVKPPGPAYETAPGYFSTPALYKSIDWLSDNGAVLYTMAMHGLLTGDKKFIAQMYPKPAVQRGVAAPRLSVKAAAAAAAAATPVRRHPAIPTFA